MEDHTLRDYIRSKIENGHLPTHDGGTRVWGGQGHGETCNGCEETITKDQLVMEMEGVSVKEGEGQFHIKCFYIWTAEALSADPELSR